MKKIMFMILFAICTMIFHGCSFSDEQNSIVSETQYHPLKDTALSLSNPNAVDVITIEDQGKTI